MRCWHYRQCVNTLHHSVGPINGNFSGDFSESVNQFEEYCYLTIMSLICEREKLVLLFEYGDILSSKFSDSKRFF